MSPPDDGSDDSKKSTPVPTVRPPGPLRPPDTTSIAALRNWLILRADRAANKGQPARPAAASTAPGPASYAASPRRTRRAGQSRALRAFLDSEPAVSDFKDDPKRLAEFSQCSAQLVRAIYPYAKGPELANDEMGYGETTIDVLRRYDPGSRVVTPLTDRLSRRTKSGRQRIENTDVVVGRQKPVGEIKQEEGPPPPSGATGAAVSAEAATQRTSSGGVYEAKQTPPARSSKRPRSP